MKNISYTPAETGWIPYWEEALRGYLEDGTDPGGFLTAILENNLTESVIKADVHNLILIPKIVQWLLAEAPRLSWGSPTRVKAWIEDCQYKREVK